MLGIHRKALETSSAGLLRLRSSDVSVLLMLVVTSAPAQERAPTIRSRIARVEQGLSSRNAAVFGVKDPVLHDRTGHDGRVPADRRRQAGQLIAEAR